MSDLEDSIHESQGELHDFVANGVDVNELDSVSDYSGTKSDNEIDTLAEDALESFMDHEDNSRAEPTSSFSRIESDGDQSISQPEDSVSEPEILEVKVVENDNGKSAFGYNSVIDVDSEDEIDNLESEGHSEAEHESNEEPDNMLESLHESHEDIHEEVQDGTQSMEQLPLAANNAVEELSDESEIEDTTKSEHPTSEAWALVPIIIKIVGDSFLLIPHEWHEEEEKTKDLISLFSYEEIQSCTLHELFSLLRGNGDLFEAYDLNMADEFKIEIPELLLSFGEDNIYTRTNKLKDLLTCFHTLSANDKANSPPQLTMLLSMQPRFLSQLGVVKRVAAAHGDFPALYSASSGAERSDEQPAKRRKLEDDGTMQ